MSEMKRDLADTKLSRRGALAAAGLAVVSGLGTKEVAHADDKKLTKDDVNKFSFDMANRKNAVDKNERQKNKATKIDATATDSTYPTSKAVFDFMKSKESYQKDVASKGKALFVGEDGNTTLDDYVVDEELKEDSGNPLQGKVIVNAINEIKKSFALDEKPTKHDGDGEGDGAVAGLKYVCSSNGYWVTYQEAKACPEDMSTCEQGVNYSYEGKAVNKEKQKWAIKKVDSVIMALNEDECTGFYCINQEDLSVGTWELPECIWHS